MDPRGELALESRIPPQNLEAEQAVLGAILLEAEAIVVAMEHLKPEDFYSVSHQRIYEAMTALNDANEPIDLVTLTAHLQDLAQIEEIGGVSYLVKLAGAVPTAANVEYYAQIVEEKALLRRLIRTATQIVSSGYATEDNVNSLLNEAEMRIMEISSRRSAHGFTSIRDVLMDVFERIEFLYNNKGGVSGIPSGFIDLDRMTNGFQKNDLIIVAARPSVGKTAFALNIAQNVAVRSNETVAIFNLEMSAPQLVQRIICAESNVDAQRMRTGDLRGDDWEKLSMAIGTLSEAQIYIDDTPGISVADIRAKCRRLKKDKGLGMVLIDYLQLIQGRGRSGENRQQEVSEISRTLKLIARELEVPVIALSQLSRGVEQRQDKRPMMSDLRESGCLSHETLITRADTGERVEIGSLVGQENIPVLSMNQNLKLEVSMISKVFSSGFKQLFELKTASGRTIKASANHPFYTVNGWKALEKLAPGDKVAIGRKIALPGIQPAEAAMSRDELGFLAHLIGDGCTLSRQPIHYTSADDENISYVAGAAERMFGIAPKLVQQKNWKHAYLTSPYHLTHGRRNPISEWLEQLEVWNLRSYEKRIPRKVFRQPADSIRWFLHHLWATDGSIAFQKGRHERIYYASSSRQLAEQVQHLLLRLGILGTVRTIDQGKYRPNYHVDISGKEMQLLFLETVGCYGSRGNKIADFTAALRGKRRNPNRDVIPKEVWGTISDLKESYGLTWRKICVGLETAYSGSALFRSGVSRDRMLRLQAVIPDKQIRDLATSDIYWDEVVGITPLEIEEVFDATVPGNHNFVANDFIVHNSIEQDADIVAFLYRDDYYDKESEKKNMIEIIVAKQRNGPVGTVELAFLKNYNKFVNIDRGHEIS